MAIKLLPKSEIDRLKAVEQRTAVDEGAKLAKRVDRLREVSAETEAQFKSYRDKSIATINEEITKKAKERDEIKADIIQLEIKRIKLQEPLDEEWTKVNAASVAINERTEEANVREYKLSDREGEVALKEKKISSALIRAQTKDDLATSNLRDAALANSSAQQARASAERIKEEALGLRAKVEKELIHRETLVENRENDATLKEQDLATREKALADGWKLLADRTALFERSIKRVNKTSNGN